MPPSNQAVTGIYVLDDVASEKTKLLQKSDRGELEIVDLLNMYLNEGTLKCEQFQRGVAWLDTGTPESCRSIAFVETVEKRQGYESPASRKLVSNNWISQKLTICHEQSFKLNGGLS